MPKNIGENSVFSERTAENSQKRQSSGKRRRRAEEPPKALTDHELQRLFEVIKDKRDEALFRVMYCKALRVSEAGLLELKDFDDRGARLTVHRLKGSISGTYPMHDRELRALRAWIRIRGTAQGPIFLSRNHRALSVRQIRAMFERYALAAGIPKEKAHPHTLKHSRGTHLLDETGSVAVVQDALGHANISNTMIYSRVTNRAREEAVAKNRSKY